MQASGPWSQQSHSKTPHPPLHSTPTKLIQHQPSLHTSPRPTYVLEPHEEEGQHSHHCSGQPHAGRDEQWIVSTTRREGRTVSCRTGGVGCGLGERGQASLMGGGEGVVEVSKRTAPGLACTVPLPLPNKNPSVSCLQLANRNQNWIETKQNTVDKCTCPLHPTTCNREPAGDGVRQSAGGRQRSANIGKKVTNQSRSRSPPAMVNQPKRG